MSDAANNAEVVAATGDWTACTEHLMRAYFALLDDPNIQVSGPLSLVSYVVESVGLVQLLESLLGRTEISLDSYRDDLAGMVTRSRTALIGTEPPNEAAQAVPVGAWVSQAFNMGQVAASGQYLAAVRWINDVSAFRFTRPVLIDVRSLTLIEEPKLTRKESMWYSGYNYQWLYELNRQGIFGGSQRVPFFVYPHELDAYIESQSQKARKQ